MLQIHEKIEAERIKAGLTQDEMAEKLGIKRSTYQYWEKNTPKVDKVKAVAEALGKPADYFFVTPDEKFVTPKPELNGTPPAHIPISWQDYIKLIHFSLEQLMAGQNEILKQQAYTRAEVRGYGKYHLVKDAKGRSETFDKLLAEVDRLVNGELDDPAQDNPPGR